MQQIKNIVPKELVPGITGHYAHGERLTFGYIEIKKGSDLPVHQHPHEQIVSMIAGELELVVDGVSHRLTPGQVFVIPPEARHSGRAMTACRVLDAFAPVREDYK